MKNMEWDQLMGQVEVDETYVGGKDKNRHWNKKTHKTGGEASGKVPVIGAISRKGNVVCQAIQNTKRETLQKFVKETVSSSVKLLATDGSVLISRTTGPRRRNGWRPLRVIVGIALRTKKYLGHCATSFSLKDRFDAVLKAICAQEMRRFASVTLFLQCIAENVGPLTHLGELVFLSLSVPCFKISHFFFKCAYAIQRRQMIRLGRKCACLGGQDFSLQFDDLAPHHSSVTHTYQRLRDIHHRIERLNHSCKSESIGHR